MNTTPTTHTTWEDLTPEEQAEHRRAERERVRQLFSPEALAGEEN